MPAEEDSASTASLAATSAPSALPTRAVKPRDVESAIIHCYITAAACSHDAVTWTGQNRHRTDAAKHVGTAAAEPNSRVLLQVMPITVHGPSGSRTTNALLDMGSQVTLVTDSLCNRLGISGPSNGLVLKTVNGSERLQSRRVCFSIESVGGSDKRHDIRDAQTTPTLNMSHHSVDGSTAKRNWPHLADLELPGVTSGGTVDLLLGTDVLALIVPREVVEGPPGTPWAVRTLLGWLVTGHTPQLAVNEPPKVKFTRRQRRPVAINDEQPPHVPTSLLSRAGRRRPYGDGSPRPRTVTSQQTYDSGQLAGSRISKC